MAKKRIKLKDAFKALEKAYKDDNFDVIFNDSNGNRFLKLRSVSRKELLVELAEKGDISIEDVASKELFEFLFCSNVSEEAVDEFIKEKYKAVRDERIGNEENLYTQLSRLTAFDWGGFYQNSVEITIVNNYIKKIQDYNNLVASCDNDLAPRLKKYVLCSWYNHWSTILIEDMFNDHEDITPAIGKIKKVDFFWREFPFDLKVTYFPSEFMKTERSEKELSSELTELKRFAKVNGIHFDKTATDGEIYQELVTKLSESINPEAIEFMENFHATREQIIEETIDEPDKLIRWFYENQGVRRFDAANRIFVVLIDKSNLDESWKLKRNKELLSKGIIEFLNENKDIKFKDLRLKFHWEGKEYTTHAICIFIVKE